jgi:hypothetical protein
MMQSTSVSKSGEEERSTLIGADLQIGLFLGFPSHFCQMPICYSEVNTAALSLVNYILVHNMI